jgi:hypothetical protein
MFIFVIGVQVVIDAQWLILVPPRAVKVITNNGNEAWICNHFTWEAKNNWNEMAHFVRTGFENHLLTPKRVSPHVTSVGIGKYAKSVR